MDIVRQMYHLSYFALRSAAQKANIFKIFFLFFVYYININVFFIWHCHKPPVILLFIIIAHMFARNK